VVDCFQFESGVCYLYPHRDSQWLTPGSRLVATDMGTRGAKATSMGPPKLSVEESVGHMTKVVRRCGSLQLLVRK